MKINEFERPQQLDEGLGDAIGAASRALIGDYATSAIKGAFTGRGTKNQLTYDLFFKDFYNDAMASLKTGIQSGIVDPNLKTGPAAPANNAPPAAADSDTKPPSPTPPEAAEKPSSKQAVNAVQQGLPKQRLDITGKTGSGIGGIPQNKFTAPASQAELDADWERMASGTNENTQFHKLNYIFENIMQMMDDENQPENTEPTAMSISQFMMEFFTKYMSGVNWKSKQNMIQPLVLDIQRGYQQGGYKDAIKNLAKAAYTLQQASGSISAGAKNAAPASDNKKSSSTLDFGVHDTTIPTEFEKQMQTLQKTNPQAYKAYIAKHRGK